MSGPKRNPDKLNTIGIIVIGICSAVLVYVTIVALQAFYMNDTSEIQTMADYGGQDTMAKTLKADQLRNITEAASNMGTTTFRIPIEAAIQLVVTGAQNDPSHLVPALPPATKPTIEPIFGRPKMSAAVPPPPATPPAGEGTTGSTGPTTVPTGAGQGPPPVAGSGPLPAPPTPPPPPVNPPKRAPSPKHAP
jgi:hypothetical protein